jgi:transposase
LALLEAIHSGRTNLEALADLAKGRLRKKLPLLREAIQGRFRAHHRFMLGQIISHLDFLDGTIEDELLATITGVKQRVAEGGISEIGMDMNRFLTHRHCASWTALCPGNNESAGKRKSGKTRWPGFPC